MPSPIPNESPLHFVMHPPERGYSRAGAPAQAGGCCCCCCCCCLHTLGGLIGAVVAPAIGSNRTASTQEEEDYEDLGPRRDGSYRGGSYRNSGLSAVGIFWLTQLALIALALIIGPIIVMDGFNLDRLGAGLLGVGFTLLMTFPIVQFIGVLITAIILGLSGRENLGTEFRRLGKIALGTFLGTTVGLLIMGGVLFMFTLR